MPFSVFPASGRRWVTFIAALILATTSGWLPFRGAVVASAAASEDAKAPPQLVARTGHSSFPAGGFFSRDGKLIVTYDYQTCILWTRSGEEIRQVDCPGWQTSLSPSAKYLLGVSGNTVVEYSTETGEDLHKLSLGEDTYFSGAVFLSDEASVATLSRDTVSIWDLATEQVRHSFKCTSAIATGLEVSPAGDVLVTFGGGRFAQTSLDADFTFQDTAIRLWDAKAGKLLHELKGHLDSVNDVAFSRDGRLLASAGQDGRIRIWDVASGDEVTRLKPHGDMPDADASPLPPCRSVDFSPDGRSVVSTSGGQYAGKNGSAAMQFKAPTFVRIWDIASGEAETIKTYPSWAAWGVHVKYAPEGKEVLVTAGEIQLLDLSTRKPSLVLNGLATTYGDIEFTSDGKGIVAAGSPLVRGGYGEGEAQISTRHASLWDLNTGSEAKRIRVAQSPIRYAVPALSRNGTYLVVAASEREPDGKSWKSYVKVFDPQTLRELWTAQDAFGTLFSPDEKLLLLRGGPERKKVQLCESGTGKVVREFSKAEDFNGVVRFSTDSRCLVTFPRDRQGYRQASTAAVWDVSSGSKTGEIDFGKNIDVDSLAISPDNKMLAASGISRVRSVGAATYYTRSDVDQRIRLFDVASGKEIRSIPHAAGYSPVCTFSPDGKRLLVNSKKWSAVDIVDLDSGAVVKTLTAHRGEVVSACYSPDGLRMATASQDGTTRLWDAKSYEEICQIISFVDGTWMVAKPDGRFDTNGLEAAAGLRWVIPDDPMQPVPFEIFMRDYYEPRLLPRLLAGEEFPPAESVAKLNRVQPKVNISRVSRPTDGSDTVAVSVDVESVVGARAPGAAPEESGVFDVRLFRDGQLVGYAPSQSGRVDVDPATRKRTVTFDNIRLPRDEASRQVVFAAYAFNSDHVKSATDVKSIQVPSDVKPAKGRAYVIAVGVNANARRELSLRFAARDALTLSDALSSRLARTGAYEEVVPVSLVSDYDAASDTRAATKRDATKANFKAVIDALAGRSADRAALAAIPGAAGLRKAGPEDAVIIAFAGHGFAGQNGVFFLVPYDTGDDASGTGDALTAFQARCVSSDEISTWLRDVDAGEMVMIIDACQSAASVDSGGFKPGPMGSRGLGQLAYDKGMRILAASQADNFALESSRLQHGLLTYALVHDGLEGGLADNGPHDGAIQLSEWLAFGASRVPQLCDEIRAGRTRMIVLDGGESPERAVGKMQRPQLFDFTRVRKDIVLVPAAPK